MSSRFFRRLSLGLALLACALVTWFSLVPAETIPAPASLNDKIQHFAAYGVLGGLFSAAQKTPRPLTTLLGLGLYGVLIETGQAIMPFGREGSVTDAVANVAGAALGALVWTYGLKTLISSR